MSDQPWGHCKHCKYFGSPAAQPLEAEESRCLHPALSKFELRVYGSNGCNGFELRPGLTPQVEMPMGEEAEAAPPP